MGDGEHERILMALERFFPTTLINTSSDQYRHAADDGLAHMSSQAKAGIQITPIRGGELRQAMHIGKRFFASLWSIPHPIRLSVKDRKGKEMGIGKTSIAHQW
jgi:hypothetical protein